MKMRITRQAGLIGWKKHNTWMLLIPLIYPGLLFSRPLGYGCSFPWVDMLLLCVAVVSSALAEEIMFRGVLQGSMMNKKPQLSPFKVTIITSLFFALGHLSNLQFYPLISVVSQINYAFAIGLLFSAIHYRLRNIWLLGLAHGLLNFLSSGCSRLMEEKASATAETDGYLFSLLGQILILLPLVLFYWLILRSMLKNKEEADIYSEKP